MASAPSLLRGGAPTPSPWASRIASLQAANATPQLRATLVQRAEQQRNVRQAYLSAHAVSSRSNAVFGNVNQVMTSVRDLELNNMRGGAESARAWGALAASASPQMMSAGTAPSRRCGTSNVAAVGSMAGGAAGGAPAAEAEAALDLPDQGEWEGLLTVAKAGAAGAAAAPPPPVAAAADGAAAFETLLGALRLEPTDAAECGAKWVLFETYLATVVVLRASVIDTADRAKIALADAPLGQSEITRLVASLDSHEHYGVVDAEGVWIVHSMAVTASRNHARLSAALRDMQTKLRLLLEETATCPMCLEETGAPPAKAPKTLSCCHRTCAECWVEWTAVHPAPFCPLCHHVEFVEAVTLAARTPRGAF